MSEISDYVFGLEGGEPTVDNSCEDISTQSIEEFVFGAEGQIPGQRSITDLSGTPGRVILSASGISTILTRDIQLDISTDLLPSPVVGDINKFLKVTEAGKAVWSASSAVVAWGDITGTLSDQADLQAALDSKENTGVAASLLAAHNVAYTHTDIALNTTDRHSHSNKAILDATQESFTTALKSTYDGYATTIAGKEPALGNPVVTGYVLSSTDAGVRSWVVQPSVISNHSALNQLDYASAGHTGFEPTVSKGNLTELTSSILTITSGANAVIGSGTTIEVQLSDSTHAGYLSSANWTTFNSKQAGHANLTSLAALSYASTSFVKMTGANTFALDTSTYEPTLSKGNLTEATSSVLTITDGTNAVIGSGTTIEVDQADTNNDGYLSSTDWDIFNGKQDALGYTAENVANKSTDVALGASDTLYPTQNAVKTYADALSYIASDIEVLQLGSPTYDDVQDWLNITQSSGRISGGVISQHTDAVTGVTTGGAGSGEFKISGDYTAIYVAGLSISISGSTGNDGEYTVKAGGSSHSGGTTTIPVDGAVSDATVDGDVLNGRADVTAGTGMIKIADAHGADTKFFDWTESLNLELTGYSTNYIYVSYNSGSPIVKATTDRSSINVHTEFPIGITYRGNGTTYPFQSGMNIIDSLRHEHERLIAIDKFAHASGGEISESGTRNIDSTDGLFFRGLNEITTTAKGSLADKMTTVYYDGSNWVWTEDETAINNTQYNNIASGLATLSNNKYGVHWVCIDYNGNLFSVFGQGDYTLTEAQNVGIPSLIPVVGTDFGVVAAKVIVEKNAAGFTEIVSAYTTAVTSATPATHNDLSGLQGGTTDEYYHLTSAQHTIAIQAASTSLSGYLSTTDWNTFNGKQDTLTFGIANGNAVDIDSVDVANGEYAKFTANGLESKTYAEVKTDLSLSNVDNTSDADKPVSTATQTALDLKAAITNVTLNAATDISAKSWVIDEDDMVSDLATKLPTQQSVKAYVDNFTGANTALSNLASVAVNASIISDADITDDLGSSTYFWRRGYFGSVYSKTVAKTSNYVITDTDGVGTVLINTAGVAITLPAAANNTGRELTIIKNVSTNTASQITGTINGVSNPDLDFYHEAITITSDGSSWILKHHYIPLVQYSPSVTGTNWTSTRILVLTEKTLAGIWRAKGNVVGVVSSTTTTLTLTIANVVFKNVANFYQRAAGGTTSGASSFDGAFTILNTGQVEININANQTNYGFSFDVELNAKPGIVL